MSWFDWVAVMLFDLAAILVVNLVGANRSARCRLLPYAIGAATVLVASVAGATTIGLTVGSVGIALPNGLVACGDPGSG